MSSLKYNATAVDRCTTPSALARLTRMASQRCKTAALRVEVCIENDDAAGAVAAADTAQEHRAIAQRAADRANSLAAEVVNPAWRVDANNAAMNSDTVIEHADRARTRAREFSAARAA